MDILEVGVCYSKASILLQSRKANPALTFTSSEIQLLNIYSSNINELHCNFLMFFSHKLP